jgi:hypothetical protein
LYTHLEPSDYDNAQLFGWSLDMDGDVIVVGARDDDIAEFSQAGSAYVFRYSPESGQWIEEQKFTAFEPGTYQLFGQSVAIDDDVIIVGAHGSGNMGLPGAAYVFRHDGKKWQPEQQLLAPDGGPGWWFGAQVHVKNGVAAVGALQANNKGAVYVFRFTDSKWQFEQKLVPDSLVGCCPFFGVGVELYADATRVVASAGLDDAAGTDAGSAHIATYPPDAGWVFEPPIYSSTPLPNGFFGIRDVDGDTAFADGQDGPGDTGQIHIIEGMLGLDCNNNGQADACDIFYGVSMDSDGDRVPDECENPADINGDNMVGPGDLAELLAQWGQCPPPDGAECSADIAPAGGDDTVGVLDLAQLLAAWGDLSQ